MSKPLKIAQICPKYFPSIGGVETHVKELSERLVKKGYDVQVLTTLYDSKLPHEEIINNVKIKRFKTWAPNECYWFSSSLKGFLKNNSNNFDIVHAHSYHAFPALYAAKTKDKNRLILTTHYHGTGHSFFRKMLHIPYKALGQVEIKNSDKLICVSSYEKELILNNFRIDPSKIVVIPNGIKVNQLNSPQSTKKNNSLLYVGRLEKYKGVQHIIKSLRYLKPNITLEVVGKGPYKKSLLTLVTQLGLSNRVTFFEDLSYEELMHKYANADLFVLLSEHEAFGISVGEALASRVPCVVADNSALTQWVDNKNCFGIKNVNDPLAVAQLIDQVIGKTVSDLHLTDWGEVAERTAELYDTCNGC